MIDESCKVPRENLDDGFNPCRKQVVENGELCQYAHMYDVMNERYDREDETSYLDWAKRARITQSTPSQTVESGKLYAQTGQGVEGFIKSSGTLDPTTHAEIPSSKAVADYAQPKAKVKDGLGTVSGCNSSGNALDRVMVSNMEMSTASDGSSTIPSTGAVNVALATKQDKLTLPLSIEQGGTGGSTPYVTDDLDSSAIFVMHDAPNNRYDAAPMSALTGYLDTQYLPVNSILIPPNSDLNEYKTPGKYAVRDNSVVPSIINTPVNLIDSFYIYVFPVLTNNHYIGQQLTAYDGKATYYRYYVGGSNQWTSWTLLYPTPSSTIPNPLPVDQGGTGAQKRSLKTAAGLTLLPVIDSIGASGALNGYTSVTNIATFITTNNIRPEIAAAFENHIADAVADNDLLPTNALMMDYVDAHSMDTPPGKFYYAVSPFPSDTWEGEMTINVLPVFSAKIGSDTYVLARVYSYKRFNYTGTADNINLFTSLKPVGDYTGGYRGSTSMPMTFDVIGRSNTDGTYGFTPKGSAANLALNCQTVSSVFNMGNFGIASNLNCVFGEGTNTPGVTVKIDCPALMLYSAS